MKYIYRFLFLLFGIAACSDDDQGGFKTMMSEKDITFKPIAGGAVMYYKLPAGLDIYTIQVKYTDAFGNDIRREASYLCDSIVLDGFTEARRQVPAFISLLNLEGQASAALEVAFETADAVPVAFFAEAEVIPAWDGFQLTYKPQEKATGYAHVFYVGINPHTQKQDTLLLKTFPITKEGDTHTFTLQQKSNTNTVVVRTEDFRGNRVKQQVWKNVEAYKMEQMNPSDFEFLDPLGMSMEDENYAVGIKYLFDGDKKGERCLGVSGDLYYTFLSKPGAVGKHWIVDLQEEKVPASVRLYGMFRVGNRGWIWGNKYANKVPNEMTIYGSNDKDDDASWEKIGYFHQFPEANTEEDNWAYWCDQYLNGMGAVELHHLEGKAPNCMNVDIKASPNRYRYLKLEVNSVFKNMGWGDTNPSQYVTFHELEVYVKQE
ncbi:MAG: DUF4959 domain-containing protein [Odoribacter sp.]|nr:DUF4959 domain-containing protein [Odoribacter sp.]